MTAESPEVAQTSTAGFPIQVVLVCDEMMGAIAVFILLRQENNSKKMVVESMISIFY